MEKSKVATTKKTIKSPATSTKSKKGGVTNVNTTTGATSRVKSKAGHGLANEGTTGSYEAGE